MLKVGCIKEKVGNFEFSYSGERHYVDEVLENFKPNISEYMDNISYSDSKEDLQLIVSQANNKVLYACSPSRKNELMMLYRNVISLFVKTEISKLVSAYQYCACVGRHNAKYYESIFKEVYKQLHENHNGIINSLVHNTGKNDITFTFKYITNDNIMKVDAYIPYLIRITKIKAYTYQIYIHNDNEEEYFSKVYVSLSTNDLTKYFEELLKGDLDYIIDTIGGLLLENNYPEMSVTGDFNKIIEFPERIRVLFIHNYCNETDMKEIYKGVKRPFDCDEILKLIVRNIFRMISNTVSCNDGRTFKEHYNLVHLIRNLSDDVLRGIIDKYGNNSYMLLHNNKIPNLSIIKEINQDIKLVANIFEGKITNFRVIITVINSRGEEIFSYENQEVVTLDAITETNIKIIKDTILEYPSFNSMKDEDSETLRNYFTVYKFLEQKFLYS